jgi:hypothetical protein
MRPVLDQIKA